MKFYCDWDVGDDHLLSLGEISRFSINFCQTVDGFKWEEHSGNINLLGIGESK